MTLHDAIAAFIAHQEAAKKSRNTLRSYFMDLRKLANDLAAEGVTEPQAVTVGHLEAHLAAGGYKPWTITRKLSTFCMFWDWAIGCGFAPTNPANAIPRPTISSQDATTIPLADVRRVVEAATGPRERAALELLALGVLPQEVADLPLDALNLDAGTLAIPAGGTNRVQARTLDLPATAWAALKDWTRERHEHLKGQNDHLFVNNRGGAAYRMLVWMWFSDAAKAAGVKASTQDLRRTRAAELFRQGHSLDYIQAQLGHAVAGTTARYKGLAERESAEGAA